MLGALLFPYYLQHILPRPDYIMASVLYCCLWATLQEPQGYYVCRSLAVYRSILSFLYA